MDNATRIYKELLHEQGSLWYISDKYGFKITVKVPSTTIRALIKGCRVDFLFGKDILPIVPVFHTAIRIYDDPIHHLTISGANRFFEENAAVEKIMMSNEVPIEFYNELNICVATGTTSFSSESRKNVLALLGNPAALYGGDFSESIIKSLDNFVFSIDSSVELSDVYKIDVVIIEVQITDWKIIQNTIIGLNNSEKIAIDNLNEGEIFEQLVWAPIQSLFDYDVIRKPQIKFKKGMRELTDVLAYSEYGIFLIESKALAVLSLSREISMERKVANLQKDIKKGIKQLIGAAKKVQKKEEIYDLKGNAILFDKTICPHCIILVSEMLPFGEWKEIELMIFETMVKQPMYLNIIDLKEFMQFVGYSRGSKYRLDYFLMERVKMLINCRSIHMRANFTEK